MFAGGSFILMIVTLIRQLCVEGECCGVYSGWVQRGGWSGKDPMRTMVNKS